MAATRGVKRAATKATAGVTVAPPDPAPPEPVPIHSVEFLTSPQVEAIGTASKTVRVGVRARDGAVVSDLRFDRMAGIVLVALDNGALLAVPTAQVRAIVVRPPTPKTKAR